MEREKVKKKEKGKEPEKIREKEKEKIAKEKEKGKEKGKKEKSKSKEEMRKEWEIEKEKKQLKEEKKEKDNNVLTKHLLELPEKNKQILVLGLDGAGKTSVLHSLALNRVQHSKAPTQGFDAVCIPTEDSQMEFLERP